VAVRPVRVQHRKGGREWTTVDRLGGLFTPVPKKQRRPVYSYGPGPAKDVLFQCPVSAIPTQVQELLYLWWACRQMRTLPVGGGFLDQPHVVRLTFPVLEAQYRAANPDRQGDQAERAAALAVGSMVKMLRGGR
jgi:hypothetical protein